MTGRSLPTALELARHVISAEPAGLLTDYDGTLAPIVSDPDAARPQPGAAAALDRLSERVALVGIVSGRAATDARRLLGSDRLLVIGNHGLEWLEPDVSAPRADASLAAATDAVRRVAARVPREPGLSVEDKGLSATVHVRNAPDPEAARRRVLDALAAEPHPDVVIRPGRLSLELRPAGAGDKGSAVAEAARRHALRGLVVLGDDVTDLDMFRVARRLSDDGVRVAVIGVGGGGEVPPEVADAADVVLDGPAEVVALLEALAEG